MELSAPLTERGDSKVIVVGAGPVGMYVALRLAQSGIAVQVTEKEAALDGASRAAGYFGATLHALDRAKVLQKAIGTGFVSGGMCWRKPLADDGKGGKRYGDVIARMPFPKGDDITEPQSVVLKQSKLTKILFEEAEATGLVAVHFNSELIDIHDRGDSIRATFKRTDISARESHEASFLVGADGGKSASRKLLKIPFQGHSWPERLLAIDCLFETPLTADTECPTSFVVHPVHFGVITPIEPFEPGKKSVYRCASAIEPSNSRSDDDLVSKDSVDEVLNRMIPSLQPFGTAQALRAAPYHIHQLCASTFRRGRCVLAGDAAHLNNPFGAMGLCTGLLDGEALADTLELIINEGKPLDLLDVYSDERRRVFQFFTNPVSSMNKSRCELDPERATDDWFIRMLNTNPGALKNYGRQFFDAWGTDMRSLIANIPAV